MVFNEIGDLKTDLSIPGTTVLVGEEADIKLLGLHEKKNSDIILIPQPSSDPNDPLTWAPWRKHLHFIILFFFGLILAAASNFVGPIYTLLVESYGATYNELNTGGGLTYLFLGFSCLVCQPIADKIGRRPVYLFTTLLTIISNVIFIAQDNFGGYMGWSVLIGWAVGPIDSLIEVSITDIFFLHEHGKYIGIYSLTLGLGSAFGPFIAGYVTDALGYLWCGYIIIIITGALMLVEFLFLEESSYKRVHEAPEFEDKLLKIALSNNSNIEVSKVGSNLANDKDQVVVDSCSFTEKATTVNLDTHIKPKTFIQRLKLYEFTDAPFSVFTIIGTLKVLRYPAVSWCALVYGIQIWWLSLITVTESEFFMAPPYNFSADSVGLLSLAMVAGTIIGGLYSACSDMFQIYMTRRNHGIFEPEFRLLMLVFPIVCCVAGLFMYGLAPYYGVHWIVGAIGICLISIALCSITGLTLTYVLECYPKQAQESMTSILFVRNLIGTIFTFVFQYWLDDCGEIATTCMLVAFCIVINGSFLVIYFWGKRFRKYTQKWYEESS